mmetsp:Transcript_5716/g.8423  ORF Transcript_5716/g.8423 Transcript_5716/m.8423 type:complete len:669 (+) Transcript_5716:164-2170(+)
MITTPPKQSILSILVVATFLLATLPSKSLAFSTHTTKIQQQSPSLVTKRYITTKIYSTPTDDDDDDDDDDGDFPLDDGGDGDFIFSAPSLGINIGAELGPLTPEEAAAIKAEASAMIEDTFAQRLEEIEDVKRAANRRFEEDKRNFAFESERRAEKATEDLMKKIDRMSNDFLDKNEALRMGTKMAARADQESAIRGVGVDVGSWGRLSDGREVLTAAGGAVGGAALLLGSVDSAVQEAEKKRKEKVKEQEKDATGKGGVMMDVEDDMKVFDDVENRILIIADDQKDKSTKKLLDRFESLISEAFKSNIILNRMSPSSNIPIGGLNAQTVIIVATALNDKSSSESILGRLLKRTAQPGGKFGIPPSHIVCISTLGTERTETFPYSMQNLMGGKLDKRRDIEESIVRIVRGRNPGVQVPLDYTIFKIGDVTEDAKSKKEPFMIRPGDCLDGTVGVEAAAQTLMQAVAFQPAARNATLSVVGGLEDGEDAVTDEMWDDSFLRLDGPELLRIESLASSGDGNINLIFDELSEYIREWSAMFEGGAKGTGLTTPVTVSESTLQPSASERVVARSGVKISFKSTNTGAAYMSADEERAAERERSGGASSSTPSKKKPKKEGGVEVLVEKTMSGELRVRARRCDMADDTILKELSEGVILKKLEKGVNVWMGQQ